MSFRVINPVNNEMTREMPVWDSSELETALAEVAAVTPAWVCRCRR